MRSSDLRSNQVRFLIYTLTIISAIGFLIPITANFINEQITIDLIGITKSSSIGLGVIMVATTGGIGMAFVVKRRFTFIYYRNCYCKKTGEQMYEDDTRERFFCPTHGEQKMEWQTPDDRHYEYLTKYEFEQSIQAKQLGKKYNEQETKTMGDWNSYTPTSIVDRLEKSHSQKSHGSHSHSSGGGKISKKKITSDDDDDDDNFLLGMGLGLGL